MTPFLFKMCSCFSLFLCPQFAGYHLVPVEPLDKNLVNFSAKIPFGENAEGENSVRRNFLSAKIPFGENSFGENSGHGVLRTRDSTLAATVYKQQTNEQTILYFVA